MATHIDMAHFMPTKKQKQLEERLARLDEQRAQARAELDRAKRRETERERRAETRRNIILGATVSDALERGEQVMISGDPAQWLDSRLTRGQDRKAWGLEQESNAAPTPAPNQPDSPSGQW